MTFQNDIPCPCCSYYDDEPCDYVGKPFPTSTSYDNLPQGIFSPVVYSDKTLALLKRNKMSRIEKYEHELNMATEHQYSIARGDNVNSPPHYNLNEHGIECIQAIEASMTKEEFQGYAKGNVIKYLWRYKNKGEAKEDLEKAAWYLNRLKGTL